MRRLTFIWATFILLLSCLPCADISALPDVKVKTTLAQSVDQHEDHTNEDACSPFCSCACCATHSVVHPPLYVPLAAMTHADRHTVFHASNEATEVLQAIWQPPKFV